MQLITAPSKTEQIVEILRSNIKKGKLLPGSRISSVRDLSEQFSVSKRIIGCALELLESEGLIRREHGRGVFVEDTNQDDEINIYMLLWGLRNEPNNYLDEVIKISYPPVLKDKFSFFIRTVLANSEEYGDLEREIARIRNLPHIQCVLVNTCPFKKEQIKKLNKLPCPVVFFGDSKFGALDDMALNLVTGDNKLIGKNCAKFMAQNDYREITFFSMSRESFFYELFCEGVFDEAEKQGMDIAFYEIPTVHDLPAETITETYEKYIAEAHANGHLKRPILINALMEKYFAPEAEKYARYQQEPPIIIPEFSSEYLNTYYDVIFETIDNVVKKPNEIHKELFDVQFVLTDWNSKKKYLSANGNFEIIT